MARALTTIFEKRTGMTVAEAFATEFGRPIGMRDFTPGAVSYIKAPELSEHRAAMFSMSGRDLARFGELCRFQDAGSRAARAPEP